MLNLQSNQTFCVLLTISGTKLLSSSGMVWLFGVFGFFRGCLSKKSDCVISCLHYFHQVSMKWSFFANVSRFLSQHGQE